VRTETSTSSIAEAAAKLESGLAMISLHEFALLLGVSDKFIRRRLVDDDKFPQPDWRHGERVMRWRASTVRVFLEGRAR